MRQASHTLVSNKGVVRTTEDAREKLRSALSILDDLAPTNPCLHGSPVEEQDVRLLLKARRNRAKFFPGDLFADPAWDMLLELYAAELGQHRLSVSNLCDGAGVPPTTALRWITTLEKHGMLTRSNDPYDGRRVFVRLSSKGVEAIAAYFAANPHSHG
jgi:DNA-binding MarR family transcriptional regulator